MTISLGMFCLEHPFILAPMAGITDSPFRRLMKHHKCPMVFSALISANAIHHNAIKTLEMLRYDEEERPLGIQIFGSDQGFLCDAARYAESKGADFVDLNLGCSVPKVSRKGAGAALCRDLNRLEQILRALVHSVRIPVTIKIRLGWDGHCKNATDVVKIAADAGIAWVTVHGRTSEQGYKGKADWDLISEIKASSPIPIIGNGDVTTPELACERWKLSGVNAVMIGRGTLHNPFFFEQAFSFWKHKTYTEVAASTYMDLIREHHALLFDYYSPEKAFLHFRKFLVWYSAGFHECHKFRKEAFSCSDPAEVLEKARQFFSKNATKAKSLADVETICE